MSADSDRSNRLAMAQNLSVEDTAELRRQGDYRAFLRQISGRAPARVAPTQESSPERDDRAPGAWPEGSRPATRPYVPEDVVREAMEEYREWWAQGRPRGRYRCGCGCVDPATLLRGEAN